MNVLPTGSLTVSRQANKAETRSRNLTAVFT